VQRQRARAALMARGVAAGKKGERLGSQG
jgi:hypothetical protein